MQSAATHETSPRELVCPSSPPGSARQEWQARGATVAAEPNPIAAERARLATLMAEAAEALDAVGERGGVLRAQAEMLGHLDAAFGRTGVQSFALEGILGELQVPVHAALNACMRLPCHLHQGHARTASCHLAVRACLQNVVCSAALNRMRSLRLLQQHAHLCCHVEGSQADGQKKGLSVLKQERTQHYLEQLCSGFSLQLSASRPAATDPATAVERITKRVLVRMRDSDGGHVQRERSLRCLCAVPVSLSITYSQPV